jgi:hypothetical protein
VRLPEWVLNLAKLDRWRVRVAHAHPVGEPLDALLVLTFGAELVACEVPITAVAGAAGLDVGALAACLPAAGDDDRALDRGALELRTAA